MNKIILLFIAILTNQAVAISVDFFDEQLNNQSTTGIRLRIKNDSNAPISNAKLRYYFHRTQQPYIVDSYYLANASISLSNVNNTLAYFEINISSIPVGYYPDMAGFSLALHNDDWSSRDKFLDYSYQASSAYTQNTKVVLLSNNDVIFGEIPNVETEQSPEMLKITGLKFSDNAWLEIQNVGSTTVSLSNYQLIDANSSTFSLNNSINAGEIFRVCQNQTACGNINKSQVLPDFNWGNNGEAFLKRYDNMVSYVAWGTPGIHADEAIYAGVWNNALAYFPAETQIQTFNANYTKNTFFRLKPNKSGANTDDWFSFTSNDNPADAITIPTPIKTSANQPLYRLIPGDNNVLFSWLPIEGINSYRIVVHDQNNNDVYNFDTSSTSVSLALAPGNYSWTVIGEDEFSRDSYYQEDNSFQKYNYNIEVAYANIDTSIFKQHKIHRIKGRRDTRMLNLTYLSDINKYSWDRPNLESRQIEPTEEARCWAIAIEVLNHFFGGNLTQDEIVYKGQYRADDPYIIPLFGFGGEANKNPETGELTGNIPKTLKWALNLDNDDDLNYAEGSPSYEIVKNAIDNGKLIYINTPGHSMVIFGYVGSSNNHAFYYAFDGYNDGYIRTSLNYSKVIESYFIPNAVYGKVKMSDSKIYQDSDSDGIINFDEEFRFHTNPFRADSDNDGIEDKREIYEYTIISSPQDDATGWDNPYRSERFISNLKKNPLYTTYAGIIKNADKNKNHYFAEFDSDDNNDNIEDGLVNYHAPSKKQIENMEIPGNYTIFGREFVTINDNVKCFNTQYESDFFCNIASSDEDIFSYGFSYTPLSIGARAHVGNIDFINRGHSIAYPNIREKILLRNSSTLHGIINGFVVSIPKLQELKEIDSNITIAKEKYLKNINISDYINIQNGCSVQNVNMEYSSKWDNNYIYTYSTSMPSIPQSKIKIVQNGERYYLKDNEQFKILHVQAGGTLIIEPGEIFVDSILQIDANATIQFAEPGKGTILHTNGQIIWHVYNSKPTSDTQYWINVAQGFKLVHHSSQTFYAEGMWAGTIYAPKAKVILGQVTKNIYGRFLARDIIVHQFAKVYRVDFNPTDVVQVTYAL